MNGAHVTIALALLAGAILAGGLARTVGLMRRITGHLATIHLVLRAVAERTDPVGGHVAGIAGNVHSLEAAVTDLVALAETRPWPGPRK